MDAKVKGLVIDSKDYKENDKLITLFTLNGTLLLMAKSVKKQNSKLKASVLPFCFGDYEYSTKGNTHTLTGANVVDTFFDITADYETFNIGAFILKICKNLSKTNTNSSKIFVAVLQALDAITYKKVNPQICLFKLFLEIYKNEGYALNLKKCSSCNTQFEKNIYLNLNGNELVCDKCKQDFNLQILGGSLQALKLIDAVSFDGLCTYKFNEAICKNLKNALISNFNNIFDCNLKF